MLAIFRVADDWLCPDPEALSTWVNCGAYPEPLVLLEIQKNPVEQVALARPVHTGDRYDAYRTTYLPDDVLSLFIDFELL